MDRDQCASLFPFSLYIIKWSHIYYVTIGVIPILNGRKGPHFDGLIVQEDINRTPIHATNYLTSKRTSALLSYEYSVII